MKTVYICGAHSTGKTTLVDYLKAHLKVEKGRIIFSEEIARKILKESNVNADDQKDINVFIKMNLLILKKQCEREEENKKFSENSDIQLCISDRGVLDPICYLRLYAGENVAENAMKLTHVAKHTKEFQNPTGSLPLVMKPFRKYLHNDNVRIDTNDFQEIIVYDETMKELFTSLKINFQCINEEDLIDRAQFIVNAIRKQWPFLPVSLKL